MSSPLATIYFGGSFDPFHNGHLQIAQAVRSQYAIDKIHLLPRYRPTSSPGLNERAGASHRLDMLDELCSQHPYLIVDMSEIEHQIESSCQSLRLLREERGIDCPGFVIGGDQLLQLHRWQNARELLSMARWIVARRQPSEPAGERAFARQCRRLTGLGAHIDVLEAPIDPVSSSEIRQKLRRREPIDDLVPPPVAGYLKTANPYIR